jgi:hypothetical protein
MKELYQGFYATRIYLPLSELARGWRQSLRKLRGKRRFEQETTLPKISWRECTARRAIRVSEADKQNGNVRISELGILAALAADCADGTDLFEIGTFDGRTTFNLALSSPPGCRVHTLDLPPDLAPKFALAEGERHMVDKPRSGARYERNRAAHPAAVAKIHQLFGDSAAFDFTPYVDRCSLIFVDGSHEYSCVLSDTRNAMRMALRGGVVLWHDYGVWEGVTRALEEVEQRDATGLRHIRGTSLVYWKKT